MPYSDLRDWIEQVDQLGELKRISGAHWDLEIGALTEITAREMACRWALLFDDIPGYPGGHRVLTNSLGSVRRLSLSVGFPTDLSEMEFVDRWRKLDGHLQPLEPREVSTGPLFENIQRDAAIDLLKLPVPRWHELDGGRYIGTADSVLTRDPDDGWVNLGSYRVQVIDGDHVSIWIAPGRHSTTHIQKTLERSGRCPIAMVFGHDPLLIMASGSTAPFGLSEYAYAGGIRGAPYDVVRGPFTGLPLPAHAEIAIEGEIVAGQSVSEGPFGEFTGYYAGGERPEPLIQVRTLLYRDDPIMTGTSPARPPGYDSTYWGRLLRPGLIWNQIEQAGVADVRGVWAHHPGASFFVVVSIKQRYAGHAKQAALLTSQCRAAAQMGKWVVVVDDDIDVRSIEDVLWAMSTRCDPERDVEIIHDTWSQRLDPMQHDNLSSKVIVNACKPFSRLETFPKTAEVSPELRRQTLAKWADVLTAAADGRPSSMVGVTVPS
jgi:4-hydroxy-3-polyprenylbenzoate decarboxylase